MRPTKLIPFFLLLAISFPLLGCLSGILAGDETNATEEAWESDGYDENDDGEEAATQEPVEVLGDNGRIARRHLEALTDIGERWSGTAEEADAGQYIVEVFDQLGYGSEFQVFSAAGDEGEMLASANIIAVKEGDSAQVIVVGAHYDSSDEGLGSDDNASGVAVLLEAAELVADVSTPCTIYFVAFGAEEAGLLGSQAFVSSLGRSELSEMFLFVNLDSLAAGDITYVYGSEAIDTSARDWLLDWAGSNAYDLETIQNVDLSEDGEATADYAAFDQAGIPWIYFEATNWNLGDRDGYTQVEAEYGDDGAIIHTEYDDLAYLDEVFPGRVDKHLDLYVSALFALLTEYEE